VFQKGYCKAVWFEGKTDKDGNYNMNESATIPKDWIDKDTKTVYWPKPNTLKSIIHNCVPHPRTDKGIKDKWAEYTLISCGRTYKTYAEADETETATDEVASDLDDPVQESEDGEDDDDDAWFSSIEASVSQFSSIEVSASQRSATSSKRSLSLEDDDISSVSVKKLLANMAADIKVPV